MMGCVTLLAIFVWIGFTIWVTKGWGWGLTHPGFWGLTILGIVISMVLRHFINKEDDRHG